MLTLKYASVEYVQISSSILLITNQDFAKTLQSSKILCKGL